MVRKGTIGDFNPKYHARGTINALGDLLHIPVCRAHPDALLIGLVLHHPVGGCGYGPR